MLLTGCNGHLNKVQNPPQLVQLIRTIWPKYFLQAYFSSQGSLSLPFKTLFINFSPIQHVPITFEGLIPQLNTFSANQKKNLDLCARALITSSDNFPEPAGESNTSCFTLSLYFSQQKVEIYPPKLCPAKMKFYIPVVFLHYSTASMQQVIVSSTDRLSFHFLRDESPTPKVSRAWTWK